MPAKLGRGVFTPNQRYVCPSCCLRNSSLAGRRTARYQHTGLPEDHGRDTSSDSIPQGAGNHRDVASGSHIEDIIRVFMLKSEAKDKEPKDDTKIESLGKIKVHFADRSSLQHLV